MREMVDSGLFWAGKIPASWKLMDLKFVLNLTNGREVEVELDESDKAAFPVYGSGGKFKYTDNYMIDGEAIIFGRKGTIDNPIHIKDKFWLVDTAYALTNKDNQNLLRYFYYELKAFEWKRYATQTVIPSIVGAEIVRYNFPIPPVEEQQQIVSYLDARCSKIDGAIAQRKAIIDKLKEYKSAVITKAVTKGLNPDVEMKDSGIEWIGKIPKDWDAVRLKFFSYMKGRIGWQGLKSEDFISEGPYCVTGTDFINGKINWDTCYHVSEERYEMDVNIHLKVGDLLVTKDGTIGKLAIVDKLPNKACLNSHLLIIRPVNNKYLNTFLYYVMNSSVFTNYYNVFSAGSIMDSISQEKIKAFAIPLPCLNEQQEIADYLDSQCAKINEAITKQEQAVAKLEEYRKSIIYYAVTGKIDCRDI